MSLKAGRKGVKSSMIDPVTGKVEVEMPKEIDATTVNEVGIRVKPGDNTKIQFKTPTGNWQDFSSGGGADLLWSNPSPGSTSGWQPSGTRINLPPFAGKYNAFIAEIGEWNYNNELPYFLPTAYLIGRDYTVYTFNTRLSQSSRVVYRAVIQDGNYLLVSNNADQGIIIKKLWGVNIKFE